MPFSKLGLSLPIVSAVTELGYETPTPIQEKAIPVILKGKNLLAAAQTGTGKTAGFVLPILEILSRGETQRKKRVRALILAPTRELAAQVEKNAEQYAKNLPLTTLAMYGGKEIAAQKQRLIEGVDILVATPGRLLDMYAQRAVHFDEIEILVLDEADRMLDMGFIEDINKIIERLPVDRQNLLFSATLSDKIRMLAKTAVPNPVELSTADSQSKPEITQWLTTVDKDKKSALLSHLITANDWDQALIFLETKHGAAKLVEQLGKRGIPAESFHSGRSQAVREQLLEDFKSGALKYLVATGVASRGIDIEELTRVVNYDLPFPADDYIHRIGRTGRAGAKGEAITFLSKDDFKNLCMIESRLGHLIERRVIEGFEPRNPVPISVLNFKPKHLATKNSSSKSSSPKNRQPRSNAGRSENARSDGRSNDSRSRHGADKSRSDKPSVASNNDRSGRGSSPWDNVKPRSGR
ncbi:DEAD/DEAH box helicase [Enterovibrio norvegicus FF-162]|uniref:DEAD/DEAH box helicase n=1 Tax=Enterovibrio norvegicus TaxID=188144 RepID=UPI000312954D|nr:DEAD/DEAH box helicase [Enterovibrio norvegicus]OEE75194.1 DEAD/DEAH box helicase [Enterovibrio norvegicus FF-162]